MSVILGRPTVALIGNPNTGKTTLFNALTGLSHRVGNYPGVTVEHKVGEANFGSVSAFVVDLPGTYSLAARSPDEIIAVDVLLGQQKGSKPVDLVVAIVDASNLERNLYLVSQLAELNIPLVVALNMTDVAETRGVTYNVSLLSKRLGVPVVETRADKRRGVEELRGAVSSVLFTRDQKGKRPRPIFPETMKKEVAELHTYLDQQTETLGRSVQEFETFRALIDSGGSIEGRLQSALGSEFAERLALARANANGTKPLAAIEAGIRYAWIQKVLADCVTRPEERPRTFSDRLDAVLTHRVWGTFILVAVLGSVFQAIYAGAAPLMDLVDATFSSASQFVTATVPEGIFQSLLVDGLIGGVGAVLIFLPQILLLFLFVAILEDSGYMARAAFLMDRLMGAIGLSGRSVIPLISSFACAIPGIMAARTIANRRDRLATILVAPLMSCSARLPVYVLLIGAFVPERTFFHGWIGLKGLVLLAMHFVGVLVAIPVLSVLKALVLRGRLVPFLMELPSFKIPVARVVFRRVYDSGRAFLLRAGTTIFAVTVVVWALAYFPRPSGIHEKYENLRVGAASAEIVAELDQEEAGEYLRQSVFGRMGQMIEPVVKPLGWDWRIGMAALASFPAREVVISTLGTIYNLGSEQGEESTSLIQTMQGAVWPNGEKVFSLAVALSLMVFFALCAQCGATLVVIRREAGAWRWAVLTFVYMTVLAYGAAFLVFQTTSRFVT